MKLNEKLKISVVLLSKEKGNVAEPIGVCKEGQRCLCQYTYCQNESMRGPIGKIFLLDPAS